MSQWGQNLSENRTRVIVHLRSDEMISKQKFKNIKSWKNGGMEIPIHKGFDHIVYAAEKVSR